MCGRFAIFAFPPCITVVGKRAVIPAGVRIGRNVKIAERARKADFGTRKQIPSGGTVDAKGDGRPARAGARKAGEGEPIPDRVAVPISASGKRS